MPSARGGRGGARLRWWWPRDGPRRLPRPCRIHAARVPGRDAQRARATSPAAGGDHEPARLRRGGRERPFRPPQGLGRLPLRFQHRRGRGRGSFRRLPPDRGRRPRAARDRGRRGGRLRRFRARQAGRLPVHPRRRPDRESHDSARRGHPGRTHARRRGADALGAEERGSPPEALRLRPRRARIRSLRRRSTGTRRASSAPTDRAEPWRNRRRVPCSRSRASRFRSGGWRRTRTRQRTPRTTGPAPP